MRWFMVVLAAAACRGEIVNDDSDHEARVDTILACAGATCDLAAGQVCCMGGTQRDGCGEPDVGDCDQYLLCDGPEDCPAGEECCGTTDGNTCSTDCNFTVCHDADDCSGHPDDPLCRASLFVDMNYCKPE